MKFHPLVFNTLLVSVLACPSVQILAAPAPKSPKHAGSDPALVEANGASEGNKSISGGGKVRQIEGSITLAEAVNLALRQNPEILTALREIERKHGSVVELRAKALPHLALPTTFGDVDPRLSPVNLVQDKSWSIALELKQTLYAGGSVMANQRSAKFARDAAFYNLRDTLDKIVSQVRQQFSRVLATKALIAVAEESVELANQQLQDANNRFQAGTVPRFNVLRAEVEVASVKPTLIKAKNEHLIALLNLAKTLGLDASAGGRPSFACKGELQVSGRPLNVADSLILAKSRRPSLKSKRQEILAKKENIVVAQADFKPTLEASGGYKLINNAYSKKLDETLNGYFLEIRGNWKIFDSFETTGKVAQAKAEMQTALLAYEDAVQSVELEVQKTYADLQQARETIESQQQNVKQAVEALRLAQERLSAGAGTQLEVLDARVALTRARTTELEARAEYVRSLAEYDRVTATDTVYSESFNDPLSQLEKKVLKFKPADLLRP